VWALTVMAGLLTSLTTALADLPAGWLDGDIGAPGQAGSAGYTNGTWSVSGSGADIWGTSDHFNFASEGFGGDGAIIALVASESSTDPWAKAGIMFRDDLTPSAMHAAVVATSGNGVSFQWRSATGGQCTYTAASGVVPPVWVRLTRSANVFSAYYSRDSVNWTQVGSDQAVNLNSTARAGLAVTAHTNTLLNSASSRASASLLLPQF